MPCCRGTGGAAFVRGEPVAGQVPPVTAYSLPAGQKLWTQQLSEMEDIRIPGQLGTAADGGLVVVTRRGLGATVLDGRTGTPLPRLDGLGEADFGPVGWPNFSAGNHLFAAAVTQVRQEGVQ